MFVQNLFRRLSNSNLVFGLDAVHKRTCSLRFGDPRMPDKLYKTVELEMKSSDPAVMKSYEKFILAAAQHLRITVGKVFSSKKPSFKRYTLLKSIFVHRKHLVQYEIRTHYSWIHLNKLTGSTADTFLEYVERMLPEGVGLKVTRIAVEPLPDHLTPEKMVESAKSVQNFEMEQSSEVNQSSEVSLNAKVNQSSEFSENSEVNQSSEVIDNAEVNQSFEDSENAEVNQSSEFSENAEVNQSSEFSENAEVNQSSEFSENAEVNQSSEVSLNAEVNQSSEVSENAEVNQSSEVSLNAEVNQSSEVSENSEVNQSSEVSKNAEITKILNSIKADKSNKE